MDREEDASESNKELNGSFQMDSLSYFKVKTNIRHSFDATEI